jgi:hypothetical protein
MILRPGRIPKPLPNIAEEYVQDMGSTEGFLEYLANKITDNDVAEVRYLLVRYQHVAYCNYY